MKTQIEHKYNFIFNIGILKALRLRIVRLSAYSKGYKQIKEYLNTKYSSWKELPDKRFVAGNLTIYYRFQFKEWRIKADGFKGMDIATIDYPFTEESWKTLHWAASTYYQEH